MADFRTRTPSIDPMAFANLLQRKSQIDLEQQNADQKRKDERLGNILDAVKAGQTIASNMMTLAEKRNEKHGIEDVQKLMSAPPPATPPLGYTPPTASSSALPDRGTFNVQPSPEDLQNQQAAQAAQQAQIKQAAQQRQQDFMSALVKANPSKVTEELAKAKFGEKDKGFAPQQASIELKSGKIMPASFINGRYYYPNSNEEIPTELIAGKGYGLNFTPDAAGNMIGLSRSTGKALSDTSTSAPGTSAPVNEAKNIFVLPAPRRAEFVKTVEATKNDPSFRGEINKVLAASTFERSLAAKNQILDSGAPLQFRKVFGDAGNISIVEQQASEGDRNIYQKARQLVETKLKSGTLTEHNRDIMKNGLRILRESAQKNLLLQTELQAKSMKDQYPELSERLISENILGKDIYTNMKKKYPDVSAEFTDSAKPDTKVDDFFKSILGK